jgi:hypothetical protein
MLAWFALPLLPGAVKLLRRAGSERRYSEEQGEAKAIQQDGLLG